MTPTLKVFVKVERGGTARLVKLALGRADVSAWRAGLRTSWHKRRFWMARTGSRSAGRLQVLDRVLEWRVLDPAARREGAAKRAPGGPDGEL